MTRKNILTRRANQRHHSIIAQFVRTAHGAARRALGEIALELHLSLGAVNSSSSPRMFLKQSASNSISPRFSSIASGIASSRRYCRTIIIAQLSRGVANRNLPSYDAPSFLRLNSVPDSRFPAHTSASAPEGAREFAISRAPPVVPDNRRFTLCGSRAF
jgi:hypothetical protein